MAQPVITGSPDMALAEACDRMDAAKVTSIVVVDPEGRAIGIVTERDVLRAIARIRAAALGIRLRELMSSPVRTVQGSDFVYVGIARMTRLDIRHLVVVDDERRPIGMVTGRALLKVRASDALVVGDDVSRAETPAQLERARLALPGLATGLLKEGVSARNIAAVISGVVRAITGRAGELAVAAMQADGWGPPPARWSLLVLGSAGRGESLLAFDQDNAIVHAGTPSDDPWFAEVGRRINETLNRVGIPFCQGDVMARNPDWRHSFEDWKAEIRRWVFEPKMQSVMNVDIFFDLASVYGDHRLAEELHRYAVDTAAESAFFVQFLAMNVSRMEVPLGVFGQLLSKGGQLNAKKYGLLPLVSAARAKAVAARLMATGTAERYTALHASGRMHQDDLAGLLDAHQIILRAILDQQLTDMAAGHPPSAEIEPRRLSKATQRQLKTAFQRIRILKSLITSLMAG
jgi:CBS domain-containing protein